MQIKLNLTSIIAIIVILLFIFGGITYCHNNLMSNQKAKYIAETNLKAALMDTVKFYKTENGKLVATKRTIVASNKQLKKVNAQLDSSERVLLQEIEEFKKENKRLGRRIQIISAANLELRVRLDSIKNANGQFLNDSTVSFTDSTENYTYDLFVMNVSPYKNKKPFLSFNSLELPNTTFISFSYDENDPEKLYPVSLSVSHSSPYFQTSNISSYAIPTLTRDNLKEKSRLHRWWKTWLGPTITHSAATTGGFYIGRAYEQIK